MKKDIPESLNSKEQPKSPAKVTMHGDMAKKMTVGKRATIQVIGHVESLQPNVDFPDHYDVTIKEPHVEHIDADGTDDNLASMPKENLKKMITKED